MRYLLLYPNGNAVGLTAYTPVIQQIVSETPGAKLFQVTPGAPKEFDRNIQQQVTPIIATELFAGRYTG